MFFPRINGVLYKFVKDYDNLKKLSQIINFFQIQVKNEDKKKISCFQPIAFPTSVSFPTPATPTTRHIATKDYIASSSSKLVPHKL